MKSLFTMLLAAVLVGWTPARQKPGASTSSPPRILKLEELTWPRIEALDRRRTLVVLPVGMLEEHGPHLPISADTLGVMHEVNGAAQRVSQALPAWTVVIMPAINYGQSGANRLGAARVHPGTYGIRQSTLRSLVVDVGAELAQNGFRWIFVMNGHGAPTHNIALNEACDFVSQTFRVTMLHLTALFRADPAIQSLGEKIAAKHFSPAERASFGMDVHAGVAETSGMLAVRPDLVQPSYKTLPSQAGRSIEELQKVATAPGWQGYLSSPSHATPAYGQAIEAWWIDGFTDLIRRTVGGENMFAHPREPDRLPPAVAPMLERELADETAFGEQLASWLAQPRKR